MNILFEDIDFEILHSGSNLSIFKCNDPDLYDFLTGESYPDAIGDSYAPCDTGEFQTDIDIHSSSPFIARLRGHVLITRRFFM